MPRWGRGLLLASGIAGLLSTRTAVAADVCAESLARGLAELHEGQLVSARERFAACSAEACSEQRSECQRRRDEAERALPTAVFTVRDARGRDVEATVTLDADRAPIPLGRTRALDPGLHDVHWAVPTGVTGVQKLTMIEGQKGRLVIVDTEAPPPVNASPREQAGASAWPWILIAGGGSLIGAAAVFQLTALNEDSDAQHFAVAAAREESPSDSARFWELSSSNYDAAKADQAIAITCGAIGVAALAAGIVWLVVRDRSGVTASGPRLGVTF